jgi:hypothetical protein
MRKIAYIKLPHTRGRGESVYHAAPKQADTNEKTTEQAALLTCNCKHVHVVCVTTVRANNGVLEIIEQIGVVVRVAVYIIF